MTSLIKLLLLSNWEKYIHSKRILSTCFFLCLWSVLCYANTDVDSLKTHLINATDKVDKVKTLTNLSNEYRNINIDSALYFAERAISNSNNINSFPADSLKLLQAEAYNALGICYVIKGNENKAIPNFNKLLSLYSALKDTVGIANAYNNLGNAYYYFSKYEKSLSNYLKALELNEFIKDDYGIAKNTGNIGNIYEKLNQNEKALSYYFQSLETNKKVDNLSGVANVYMSIGLIYHNIENDSLNIFYQQKAVEIFANLNLNLELGKAYNNLAVSYETQNDFAKALTFNKKALKKREEVGDIYGQTVSIHNIGYCYYRLGSYNEAILNFEQSLKYALENNYDFMVSKNYNSLSLAYEALGNYEKALSYFKHHSLVKDSLYTIESTERISEIETKYQTEKKEAENKQLKIKNQLNNAEITAKTAQQKIMLISFISIIIIVILSTFFILYRRKIKTQKQLQEEEKLRFKAVIKAEEKERIRIAKDLHDGLGQLLSTAKLNVASLEGNVEKEDEFLVKNACDLIDNAVKEVRNISHNMMPVALTQLGLVSAVQELISKMNHSGLLTVKFKVENLEYRLNSSIEIALYRVIQEILNNIIKHSQAQEVFIFLKKEKERLTLEISDNGVGFNTDEIDKSEGIGWKNIFSRIAMLNGNINVKSIKEKGTNLLVSIPINE